jgi:hypothetical protein
MHSTGSMILSILEAMKFYTEEQTLDAKYENSYLVRTVMGPAMADVLSRINHTQDNPILLHHAISVTAGQEFAVLPPYVQEVWWVVEFDADGNIRSDWRPMGRRNPAGPGWILDGNSIRFMPKATFTGTIYIGYVPNGNAALHYSSGTVQTVGSQSSVVLATSPTYGMLDRLKDAYVGSYFRLLGSGKIWEERIITAYSQATLAAPAITLRNDLTRTIANGESLEYEVCAPIVLAMWEAIAARASLKLLTSRNASGAKYQMVQAEYAASLKTVRDNLSNLQMRTGKGVERDTLDNPYGLWRMRP